METLPINKHLSDVIAVIEEFGPEENKYSALNELVDSLNNELDIEIFREIMKPVLSEHTLFGYTSLKPLGYAGDYMLIEKIYQKFASENPKYQKWDKYYHSHAATEAVRNRKTYFVKTMEELCSTKTEQINVLVLGSGPATDVHEFFTKNPDSNITFDLLDIDQRAIDYASHKNKKFLHKINFIRKNVLRFLPDKKYDLIWSAGLFDYLSDRLFTGLISRFNNYLELNGEMIIGNFSPINPTRNIMERICDWRLIHRNPRHLTKLAKEAGIPYYCIFIDKEPLGINLFLRIGQDHSVQPKHYGTGTTLDKGLNVA